MAGLLVCCLMTSRLKGHPFEVVESRDPPSVVLADQVRNVDWRARRATHKGRISDRALAETRGKVKALLNL